ncbi:Ig-like domain-containing protein [Edaphobacter aggregans]|uniref:Ig-like domain-containing protein n=1 Tax=Edaphobacter aggregans TaxID=570835 RepID=UPI00054F15B4|nr:Ig-like domain-containing protein [Edaphobacter aggregans]
MHVASQTTNTPTGSVTILDSSTTLATGKVDSAGDVVFTASTLTAGSHSFTAFYSGDANFKTSTSSAAALPVNGSQTPADFTLTPTGATTQSIASGASSSFTFGTSMQNGLSSPISLSASGLPNLATASFNPAYIPPGSASATFTLTITTPKTARLDQQINHPATYAILAFLFFPLGSFVLRRSRTSSPSSLLAVLILLAPLFCVGCGDRIYTGSRTTDASKTYTITVTGTATSPTGTPLQHTATVTLVVLPPS